MALNNLTAFTREYVRTKEFFDQIWKKSPLFTKLKGRMDTYSGTQYTYNLEGAKGTAGGAFAKTISNMDSTPYEFAKRAKLDHYRYYAPIAIYKDDLAMNQGKEAYRKILKASIHNASETLLDYLQTDVYAAQQGNKLSGLLDVCGAAQSAYADVSYAEINEWESNGGSGKSDQTALSGGITIGVLRDLINDCTFGAEKPDMIVTTKALYGDIENIFEKMQRAKENTGMNKLGFTNIEYKGIPIVFDDYAGSGNVWVLTTKYLGLAHLKGWDFHIEDYQTSEASDKYFSRIIFRGLFYATNRKRQGLLYNVASFRYVSA